MMAMVVLSVHRKAEHTIYCLLFMAEGAQLVMWKEAHILGNVDCIYFLDVCYN